MADTGPIFLTGGTGCELRLLVRNPNAHPWLRKHPHTVIIPGDLDTTAAIQQGIEGCTHVIHAAGMFRMWGPAHAFQHANVEGTRHIVEMARDANVDRLVHISTIAVIGTPIPGRIVDETHPARPADAYQRSKLEAEQIVLSTGDLPVVVLRPGAFYGPHGRYAFNRLFFEDPLKGLLVKVDRGQHVIFPVYVKDVARAIVSALHNGRLNAIYNICGEPISHNEANAIISREAGITPFRLNVPSGAMLALAQFWTWLADWTNIEPYYPINLRHYVFNDWPTSNTKARQELGFSPIPFEQGVRHTLAWYHTNGVLRRQFPLRKV